MQYGNERIFITKNRKAAVALVSAGELDILDKICETEDELDVKIAMKQIREATESDLLPWEDVKREPGVSGFRHAFRISIAGISL